MFVRDFEWLTSNTRIAYPFVERVALPTAGDGTLFSDLVVDAFLSYPVAEQQDIFLYSLTDPAGATPEVEFRYRDGSTAFAGTAATVRKAIIGSWTFLQWTKANSVARILLSTADISKFAWPVFPTDAYIVSHTIQPIQTSVMTIGTDVYQFNGFLEMVSGYNVNLTYDPEYVSAVSSARSKKRVTIEAVAGGGLGQYPICTHENPPIFTINGVGPDEQGNFRLAPQGCYRGEVPVIHGMTPPWTLIPHTYKLHNHCSPCCDCADYVYIYDVVFRNVYNRGLKASAALYAARDKYQNFYDQVMAQKACREQPRVDLRLTARQGWTIAVQAIISNNQGCAADAVSLNIDFTAGPTAVFVPDSGKLDADGVEHAPIAISGSYPSYSMVYNDGIAGARKIIVTFEIYYTIPYHVPNTPVSATATAVVDGNTVTDSATTRLQMVFNKT